MHGDGLYKKNNRIVISQAHRTTASTRLRSAPSKLAPDGRQPRVLEKRCTQSASGHQNNI